LLPERAGMETAARRARTRERWVQQAERVSDAFGLVFVLVLTTYVLASLLENHGWAAVILTLATSATSVVALTSSHARAGVVRLALLLSGLTVGLAAIGAAFGGHTWLNFASLVQVLLLTVAMAAVLRRVVTSAEVGFRTILGAISVYTALGILFTFLYGLIDRVQGGPFFGGVPHPQGSDYLFFSYTTLTTTGYGNLVPGGQPGRMIAGLEMMAGQIFLVTLVAGLVSLWRPGEAIRRRHERRGGEGSPVDTPPAA
jgi:ion channel